MSFHAALRSSHLSFLSRLEDKTRSMLRQHLDASTSEFAMNLMASLPEISPSTAPSASGWGEEDLVMDGGGGGGRGGSGAKLITDGGGSGGGRSMQVRSGS